MYVGVIELGLADRLFLARVSARQLSSSAELVGADGGIFSSGCFPREKSKGKCVVVGPCPRK